LNQVVVTAQKRDERLVDVAVHVSCIGCERMADECLSREDVDHMDALRVSDLILTCETLESSVRCWPIPVRCEPCLTSLKFTSVSPRAMVVCCRWEFSAVEVPDAHARGPPDHVVANERVGLFMTPM
jgi:hypothetical protein